MYTISEEVYVLDRASGGQPACPGKWKMYRKKKMNSSTSVM
jgi:hypothetical protein